VARRARRVADGLLRRAAPADPADDRHALGAHRRHLLDLGAARQSRGVTANVVAPGIIESPAVEAAMGRERIAQLVPARRAGRPEEVAAVVGFLCSDAAGYVSGQTIAVSGGLG
jgi:3-oxoacyl-[acyl-carrier protein] reductase